MSHLFDVKDRVVVITGGMGQLGRQFSVSLADQGARVAVFDVNASPKRVEERFGPRKDDDNLRFFSADITERSSLENALAGLEKEWGPPRGLVNNAALDSPPGSPARENGPFETYPESSWDEVMEVNVKGVFLTCQVIGGAMSEAGTGSVVNICSTYGVVSPDQRIYEYRAREGTPFFKPVAYCASKSALLNMTRYLATYWAPRVRVNTLTLGGVFNDQDEKFLEGYESRVPMGRMAREDEYNGAITFLLSDASSYMTGSNLVMDGGWTAW